VRAECGESSGGGEGSERPRKVLRMVGAHSQNKRDILEWVISLDSVLARFCEFVLTKLVLLRSLFHVSSYANVLLGTGLLLPNLIDLYRRL
jgi:hypothetical protein